MTEDIKGNKIILRSQVLEELESAGVAYIKKGWKVKKPITLTDNFFKSLFNPYYAHFKLIMYKP